MKTIKLTDSTIDIVESQSEINLTQFEKLIELYAKEFDSNIEQSIELLKVVSQLTQDEIESLFISDLNLIMNEVNSINFLDFASAETDTIEINGEIFKSKNQASNYKFSVKETMLFQNIFIKKEEGYICEILAIIFHPVIDGEIKYDYSIEGIKTRKDKFKTISIDIVGPFINALNSFFKF
jgi:hypothetical protein